MSLKHELINKPSTLKQISVTIEKMFQGKFCNLPENRLDAYREDFVIVSSPGLFLDYEELHFKFFRLCFLQLLFRYSYLKRKFIHIFKV